MLYFILYSDKEYFDETRNDLTLQDCNDEKFPIPYDHICYFWYHIIEELKKSGAAAKAELMLTEDNCFYFFLKTSKDLDDFINCGGLYNFGQEIFKDINLEQVVELMKKQHGAPVPKEFITNLYNNLLKE